jgi:hypothetical protein
MQNGFAEDSIHEDKYPGIPMKLRFLIDVILNLGGPYFFCLPPKTFKIL